MKGIVCDVTEARVFTESEASELVKMDRGIKYYMWDKKLIDSLVVKHCRVDNNILQDIRS
jgi:hypothetical protein